MKQDFKVLQNLFSQLLAVYPFIAECRHFHTGVSFNLMAAMLRKFLPPHLKNRFVTGLTFPGRLSTFYLMPDVETANGRNMARFEETLKRRYDNEEAFQL
jgi:hypothetical protein